MWKGLGSLQEVFANNIAVQYHGNSMFFFRKQIYHEIMHYHNNL